MKKFLRKIISGLLVLLTAITLIGCAKPISETEASSIEISEETIEEITEETTEEIAEESEETTEETTEEVTEETPEPEKYFTYKAKYVEKYPQAVIITDESYPGDLRITLSDDLPETFFEKRDCKTSEQCFNEVIREILLSLQGKKLVLRDTQKGLPKFSYVDTKRPLEIVYKLVQTKEEEIGPLYYDFDRSLDEKLGVPGLSFAFVQTPDRGLRIINYTVSSMLEDMINIPRGRHLFASGNLVEMLSLLKFDPEKLGENGIPVGEILPVTEEEKNFYKKICQGREEAKELGDPDFPLLGILTLKGER